MLLFPKKLKYSYRHFCPHLLQDFRNFFVVSEPVEAMEELRESWVQVKIAFTHRAYSTRCLGFKKLGA